MMFKSILLSHLLMLPLIGWAAPEFHIKRTTQPPQIDGNTTDQAWQNAPHLQMVQIANGDKAHFGQTEVKALWDEHNLYLLFIAQDSTIIATLDQRDEPLFTQDAVEFFISPSMRNSDDTLNKRYFEFEWSPKNTLFDLLLNPQVNDLAGPIKSDWNAVGIRNASSIKNDRYYVEVALPWTSFQNEEIKPRAGMRFFANFYRAQNPVVLGNGGTTEWSAWSPTGAIQAHCLGKFGQIILTP